MLAPTHSVFGLFLTLIFLAVFGVQTSLHWTILLCGVLGSLMPDIDLPKSTIGKVFFFVSKPLERRYGHRTITHSLLALVHATGLMAAILFLLTQFCTGLDWKRCTAAFGIGYLSHLILDMFNPSGVPLFWPNPGRDVIPKNPKFRPASGSKAEIPIFIGLTLLLILALPLSQHGFMTTLRWLLATPESAIAQAQTQTTRTYVTFAGTWQNTHERITGTAEILDIRNKKLIVALPTHLMASASAPAKGGPTRHPQTRPVHWQVVSLSDGLGSDILTQTTRVVTSKNPIPMHELVFTDKTQDELFAMLSDDDVVAGTVMLPIHIRLSLPLPSGAWAPFSQEDDRLTLHFATKQQLEQLQLNQVFWERQNQIQDELNELDDQECELRQTLSAALTPDEQSQPKPDGLTPLGREFLTNHQPAKPKKNTEFRRLELQNKLDALAKKRLNLKKQLHPTLKFSGRVWVRKLGV